MDFALLLSAAMLGLAGTPHCLAMCGAACAAAGPGGRTDWALHAGRLAGYSLAGAIAASSVGTLAQWSQAHAALRPLWTLVHVAALALGLWLLLRGRQPGWMERIGRTGARPVVREGGWQAMLPMARRSAIGLAWVAWPCGLLQSALLVAALGNSAWAGAGAMAAFALSTSFGLVAGPALWWRLSAPGTLSAAWSVAAVRLAGLMLAAASAWALGHGLWMRVVAWCLA